jgi:septum formation protein
LSGAPRLVLASRSPQRRAILEQLGVPFRVEVPEVEELAEGLDPVALAVANARLKALAVLRAGEGSAVLRAGPVAGSGASASASSAEPSGPAPPARSASEGPSLPVLGVDTVVVVDGEVFGKPADAEAARAMLARLGGRAHEVVSGICVARSGEGPRTAAVTTRVRFRDLGDALLDWYLATGEWRERAGGYAIQGRGAALVAGIEGDYLNVVGLPVATLLEHLPTLLRD